MTELERKMSSLGIREEDLIEKFIRSKAPGGQHVNKTSTCVYLKHVPTGIEVKCSEERSQSQNRLIARKILAAKIESLVSGRASVLKQAKEKARRQLRKKPKTLKLMILEAKRRHSMKKKMRAKVSGLE